MIDPVESVGEEGLTKKGKREPKAPTFKSLQEAGLERYEMVTIHRSQLKDAPYNPRVIDDAAKRKLKAILKKHGAVQPPIWNERTGHIVGGHQRLTIMDSLMHSGDYELQVAKLNVSDAEEKELNVSLNNAGAMGDWDLGKLGIILKDPDVKLEGTGFDPADVFKLLGANTLADRQDGALDELSNRLREVQTQYEQVQGGSKNRDGVEFFFIAIFRDEADCTHFIKCAKLPDNRFQSGHDLRRLCAIPESMPMPKTDEEIVGAPVPWPNAVQSEE